MSPAEGKVSTQEDVLQSSARLRVVRAAPGSGKTWLVAEAIKRELSSWKGPGGVAALSFTNVARVEIENALGGIPGHPHFIGTIDSFVYRYIIKPFAHQLKLPPLKLIPPGSIKGFFSDGLTIQVGKARINLFDVNFVGEREGFPVLSVTSSWGGRLEPSLDETKQVLKAKQQLWTKRGWISHSDSVWIAAQILRHEKIGPGVLNALSSRFPMLVVDELQDTGWFLGSVIRILVGTATVRGLLVGDPDQAIYEFNGARPDLFDAFSQVPGAETHVIPYTRRCANEVCAAAEHLSQSGASLKRQTPLSGRTMILVWNRPVEDISEVRKKLRLRKVPGKQAIVTRRNADVRELAKSEYPEMPEFASVPIKFLYNAANLLILGDMQRALSQARAALMHPVVGQPFPSDTQLEEIKISLETLKSESVTLLLAAHKQIADESLLSWAVRMKGLIETALSRNSWLDRKSGKPARVRTPAKSLAGTKRVTGLAARPKRDGTEAIDIQTVHAVKGETHNTTLLYIPEARDEKSCPSNVWWSSAPAHQEERRIAFVAATRPTAELILAMSQKTFERMSAKHPGFIKSFEVNTVQKFLENLI